MRSIIDEHQPDSHAILYEMNINQPQVLMNKEKILSIFVFWGIALIPAICVAISYLHWFLLLPYNLDILVKGLFVPVLAAFVANLVIPVAFNKQKALLFAIPTFILHLYFYSLPLFWMGIMPSLFPGGDDLSSSTPLIFFGILLFPLEILVLIITAFSGWFGTQFRSSK
ncbi:MAG: hypothetical protein WBW94_04035 [Anaerolineales bacterium]